MDSLDPVAVRGNNWVVRLCRPLANWCTPPLYNIGLSANACTGLRTTASVGAVVGLAFSGDFVWSGWLACGLFYVGFVLDCIDGNIARLSQHVTYWGKFIDGLGDLVYFALAPAAAAIGAWRYTGSTLALALGAAAALLLLANHLTRYRLSFFREWMIVQSGPLTGDVHTRTAKFQGTERRVAGFWVNVTFCLPLLLVPPGSVVAYLWVSAVFEIVVNGYWIGLTLAQSAVILNRERRSRHSAAAKT